MTESELPDPQFVARQLRRPSGEFAEEIGRKMNRANEPIYDLTLEVLDLESGDRVLEIGFGNGAFFEDLLSLEDGIRACGIDLSEEMVEVAREENRDAVRRGRLELYQGNSDDLPFGGRSFDAVFCNMVVYFWDEPARHLKEVFRVLEPGGKFYTGMRSRESMLVFPFVEFGFNLYTVAEWEELLARNGFIVEETHRRADPEIELDGLELELESCCLVATKEV